MVQKHVWIAAGVLALLVGAFFVTRDAPPSQVDAALVVEAPSTLGRLEWDRPGDERVVLESRASGWWLTSPVEAPLSRQAGDEVERAFGQTLKSDDLRFEMSEDRTFGLSEDDVVKVAIFEAGQSDPMTELRVGEEIQVPGTGVARTFAQVEGKEKIYRLQAALGELVRQPVDDLRSRSIVSLGDEALRSVQWSHADGHLLKIEPAAESSETRWMLASPQVEMALDAATVGRVVNTLSRLNARDFVDEGDAQLEALDFDAPAVTVTLETGSKKVELAVVRQGEGDQAKLYVRRAGDGQVFEVASSARTALLTRMLDVKDRAVMPMASDAMTSIELAGDDRVRLVKDDEGVWTMARPEGVEVDPSEASALASWLGALRAERWVEEIDDREAGLSPGQRSSVRVSAADGEEVLYLGASVDDLSGGRYARLASSPAIFVLPESALRRLTQDADAFAAPSDG
ncbi:DUF4340 domain-containing protein [Lujinxingia vulgaris]|uniref:DUF4340 domain-containing protein n=1 Tax=Lujinxingia vulgaris TaxID=2600176 RepID=A0A5C6XJB2_9DELT|nr:DUF4340 domain-containing protein [Lujinxingia vulgaris]TXD41211.1 DUF4340 domain-containing protein [Lujinxingia vulgaris]